MTLARDVEVPASRRDSPSAAVVALVRPAMPQWRAGATGGADPVDLRHMAQLAVGKGEVGDGSE